ncbi:Fic family protein [Candidatus Woesearchaeota archaeon]|nr:Fic family protein [Candidatus Woesearchaeota archaeon]
MLTKKDIITLNLEFHQGNIRNQNSLDFALDQASKTRDWLKATAYLTRSIIVDHVFEDGNKRTAAAVIAAMVHMHDFDFNQEGIDKIVIDLAKKSPQDIRKIARLLKHALQ